MSCEKHTKKTKQAVSENGVVIPLMEKLPTVKSVVEKLRKQEKLSEKDLFVLSNSKLKYKIVKEASYAKYEFKPDELMKIGCNPVLIPGESTVAHKMALMGQKFSIDQLKILDQTYSNFQWTIAHRMVHVGHRFTVDEIKELGNPLSSGGYSLAHSMVQEGYKFPFDELVKVMGDRDFALHRTVAHMMAERGHKFSLPQILQLGNPVDKYDFSISRLMAIKGYEFTESEKQLLDSCSSYPKKALIASKLFSGTSLDISELLPYPDLMEYFYEL